jgi:broad-specificity NMP kinase
MKIIIIHGAPAVGKLTVAEELSKITRYKVFHNHLVLDLVNSVFDSKKKIFWEVVSDIRLQIVKEAIKQKIKGIIYTQSDIASDKFDFVKKIIKESERTKSSVYFVHLICSKEELSRRVKLDSRKEFNKTISIKKLKESFKKWDFETKFPFGKTIEIDNTRLSANKTAQKIKLNINLK